MSETEKINVRLLRAAKRYLLEEPRRLHMETFAARAKDALDEGEERPPCGTVCCIAGAVVIVDKGEKRGAPLKRFTEEFLDRMNMHGDTDAAELLNLDSVQRLKLFYFKGWASEDIGWPKTFSNAYRAAKTPRQRALVTAQRIEHFIKTNGAE